jgi:hypothetical protein
LLSTFREFGIESINIDNNGLNKRRLFKPLFFVDSEGYPVWFLDRNCPKQGFKGV